MTNYRSRIADELLRESYEIVYRRIWRGLGDGALSDDPYVTTIKGLSKPSDRRERRIGSPNTIRNALWALYNLRLIDVHVSGATKTRLHHIRFLPITDDHEEELLFALRKAFTWHRDQRKNLCVALESQYLTAEAWGHVAPGFCGRKTKTGDLLRPELLHLSLIDNAAIREFPDLPLTESGEPKSIRSMEHPHSISGASHSVSGTSPFGQRTSLGRNSADRMGCQIDICGSSSGLFGKVGTMSEWEGVDELPDGGTPQSRWGKRKLPSRKMKPSYVAPSVDEPTVPPPVQKKAVGRPITADLEIDTNTWAPAAIVLPIVEDLFREKIEVGRSGVIFFYSNDTPPKAFLRELTRVETSDTFAQDPRVTQETVDGPIAVARILQHFYRLHDGRVADAHAVSNAHYLVDRLRDYSRNACRLSSLQMAETLCGYAYTASCRVAEGKVEFLPSRSPERIWSRQGYYSHTTTWEGLVARGLASDPWAYLESLPDGCCSLKQKTDSAAKESSAQAQLRALMSSFEQTCLQHNWEKTYDAEHGAGAFKALPMVERVQLVMGLRTAVKYEVLIEETTTNDSSTTHLGAP